MRLENQPTNEPKVFIENNRLVIGKYSAEVYGKIEGIARELLGNAVKFELPNNHSIYVKKDHLVNILRREAILNNQDYTNPTLNNGQIVEQIKALINNTINQK